MRFLLVENNKIAADFCGDPQSLGEVEGHEVVPVPDEFTGLIGSKNQA